MKVGFLGLTDEVRSPRRLRADDTVAEFALEDGSRATVVAVKASPFSDVQFRHWPADDRAALLQGLLSEVRAAGWADSRARTLDVAGRFAVAPEDEPVWKVLGFSHLQTVDRKVVKHVLGVGQPDPAASVAWWSKTLDLSIDTDDLLARLDGLGCTAWRALRAGAVLRSLYADLPRDAFVRCVRLLAPVREGYMEAVRDAVRTAGERATARHAHLLAAPATMEFLDDRGITVVAKGGAGGLSVATGHVVLAPGESRLGPRTLRSRWVRLVAEIAARRASFRIHSPLRWRTAP